MDLFKRELRDAWRRLVAEPGFSLVAVFTLALGLGSTLALSSVVHSVLLKPLALPEPERLVGVWHSAPGLTLEKFEHSHATYLLYRNQPSSGLESMALYAAGSRTLTGEGAPERVRAAVATPSLFTVLETGAAAGRVMVEADGRPGSAPVTVVSAGFAARRFGSREAALGRRLVLDGKDHEVIGVAPAGFAFPAPEIELWLPLTIDEASPEVGNFNYSGVARLKPGIEAADLAAELTATVNTLPDVYPGEISRTMMQQAQMRAYATPLLEDVVGETAPLLWMLLGAVAVVLAIACANVANLLLVRAEGRAREMAIKGALGAGARQQLAGWLVESLLLTFAGAALGLLLAGWGVSALVAFGPEDLPRRTEIELGGVAVGLAFGLALSIGLAFGLLPFVKGRRASTFAALTGGLRGATAGRERARAQSVLVAAQVALALVLLAASGLLVRSFVGLRAVNPGLDPRGVLTVRVALPETHYREIDDVARFYERALAGLQALPGVEAVGAASGLPLTSNRSQSGMTIEDFPRKSDELPPVMPNIHVTAGYFEAMGIPLLEGRTLTAADQAEASGACLVSQAFARRFWPGASPLGKRLQMGLAVEEAWLTIVGVVADVRHDGLAQPAPEILYLPVVGKSGPAGWLPRSMVFTLRTSAHPESLSGGVKSVLAGLDADLPLTELRTMETVMRQATASTAFAMVLLLAAAGTAVALGSVGLYGVISYLVARRRREIGVRMALGAERGRVARMVVGQGLATSALGLAVGGAATLGVGRWLKSLLFEISPADPGTLTAVVVLLVAICTLASWLPARRAAAVAPVEALRSE